MLYEYQINALPEVINIYTVTRNTVWQLADENNIFLFVNDGACSIEINQETQTYRKNSLCFIPAHQIYTRRPVENKLCTMTYIHFKTETAVRQISQDELISKVREINEALSKEKTETDNLYVSNTTTAFLSRSTTFNDPKYIDGIINRLLNAFEGRRFEGGIRMGACLCELIADMTAFTLQQYADEHGLIAGAGHIASYEKAVFYINHNVSKKLYIKDVCAYCSLSQSQLTRYFKCYMGMTPIQYILSEKLHRAKWFLWKNPEISIQEVCFELGFADPHYFSRLFSKTFGETPSHFKNRVKNYGKDGS